MTPSGNTQHIDYSRYRAAIFDLDGTLVHSEHAWEAAKIEIAARHGLSPSRALLHAHVGRGLSAFLDDLFNHRLSQTERDEIGNQIGAVADELLPEMRTPVSGAPELLCSLHDKGLSIAICSSSPRRHIVGALEMLGVSNRVEAIVSAAELPRGKPDPLPYVATLEALGLAPHEACAFEDSLPGAQSAFAAGISVLAVGECCTGSDFSFCQVMAESFGDLIESRCQ